MYADEAKDIPLKHFYRVCPKPPAVDKARHAHGHDNARRFAFQDFHELALLCGLHEIWLQDALEKAFKDGRKRAEPERKNNDQMVSGKHCIVGRLEVRLQCLHPLEALAQHRIECAQT
jgi:hypothetical protein